MKTNLFLLITFISLFSLTAFSQITVDCNGKVGIGSNPDVNFNLSTQTAIFKSGSTYSDLIITLDPIAYGVFGMAMYPSLNNYCKLGLSNKAFNAIWTYNITNLSDGRQKENIKDINNALGIILKLKGIKYDLKKEYAYNVNVQKDEKSILKLDKLRKNKVGFIAQDVNAVLPEVVRYDDSTDVYGINYSEIVPVLVEAMKEQQAIIQDLKDNIASIEANCCNNSLKSATINPANTDNSTNTKTTLEQNTPNPFSQITTIGYTLNEKVQKAMICIYDMNGKQLKCNPLDVAMHGNITINSNEFKAGMYMYSLIADGQLVDTKRMVLTD